MLTLLAPTDSLHPGAVISLADDQLHHLRVRRVPTGGTLRLIDGHGLVATATLTTSDDRFAVQLTDLHTVPEPAPLTLAVGAGDRDRFAWLVEKATELGVTRVVPLKTTLSESVATRVRDHHLERLRKRSVEALKQCGGAWATIIDPVTAIERFLATPWEGTRWRASAHGADSGAGSALAAVEPVVVAVGPEGGFTGEEVAAFDGAGFVPVAFGSYTLRFETAGLAAATAVSVLRHSPAR